MKRFLLACLLLSSCATGYKRAARAEYVGNGLYEIRSNGNGYTSSDAVRGYMFRKAFETCAGDNLGFEFVGMDDTTSRKVTAIDGTINTYTFPGGRALIRCQGPVDPKLVEKYREKE